MASCRIACRCEQVSLASIMSLQILQRCSVQGRLISTSRGASSKHTPASSGHISIHSSVPSAAMPPPNPLPFVLLVLLAGACCSVHTLLVLQPSTAGLRAAPAIQPRQPGVLRAPFVSSQSAEVPLSKLPANTEQGPANSDRIVIRAHNVQLEDGCDRDAARSSHAVHPDD